MYFEVMGKGCIRRIQSRRGGWRGGGGQQKRGTTWVGVTKTTIPLLPPELAAAAASFDLEPVIPFVFGRKVVVATTVDTPSSCSSSLSRVIFSSSWACPHICSRLCPSPLCRREWSRVTGIPW